MIKQQKNLAAWLQEQFDRTGKKKSGLAKLWQVNQSAVSKVLSGERDMSAGEMEAAEAYFSSEDQIEDRPEGEFAIPEIDVRAGAGGGGVSMEVLAIDGDGNHVRADDVKASWRLPKNFVRGELRTNSESLRIVEVLGDSMEPTLKSGDRVLIDTSHTVPSPPGVFAVWDGFGVVMKRVEQVRSTDRPMVRLISDNKSHSSYEVSLEEAHIIGRAVCKISLM